MFNPKKKPTPCVCVYPLYAVSTKCLLLAEPDALFSSHTHSDTAKTVSSDWIQSGEMNKSDQSAAGLLMLTTVSRWDCVTIRVGNKTTRPIHTQATGSRTAPTCCLLLQDQPHKFEGERNK